MEKESMKLELIFKADDVNAALDAALNEELLAAPAPRRSRRWKRCRSRTSVRRAKPRGELATRPSTGAPREGGSDLQRLAARLGGNHQELGS